MELKFPSVKLAIENYVIDKSSFIFMSDGKHWKVENENGVFIIKFYDTNIKNYLEEYNCVEMNMVGHVDINNYKGILSCQYIIDEYEIVE